MPRKAGRPSGSSPAIGKDLDQIAYMLVRRQAKTANKAVTTILRKRIPDWQAEGSTTYDSQRRHLNRCWKKQGEDRMRAAQEQYHETTRPRPVNQPSSRNTTGYTDLAHLGFESSAVSALLAAQKEFDTSSAFGALKAAEEALSMNSAFGAMKAAEEAFGKNSVYGIVRAAQEEADKMQAMIDPLYHYRSRL